MTHHRRTPIEIELQIAQEYLDGHKTSQIAKDHGLCQETVRAVLHRQSVPIRSPWRISEDTGEWTKQCPRCSEFKAISGFYRLHRHGGEDTLGRPYISICKTCTLRSSRQRKKSNPAHYSKLQRKSDLKCTYGLSESMYLSILRKQNFVCDICGQPEIRKVRGGKISPLSVDHNHATGKIRGLLCFRCNALLGQVKDSVSVLEGYISYLRKHGSDTELS